MPLTVRMGNKERQAVYSPDATVLQIADAINRARAEIVAENQREARQLAIAEAGRRGDTQALADLAIEMTSRQCRRRNHNRCHQTECYCGCHK